MTPPWRRLFLRFSFTIWVSNDSRGRAMSPVMRNGITALPLSFWKNVAFARFKNWLGFFLLNEAGSSAAIW